MRTRWKLAAGVAFSTLTANPMRTLLSTTGVVLGVGGLVAILALGDGMSAMFQRDLQQTADPRVLVISPRMLERVNDVSVRTERVVVLAPDHVEELRRRLGGKADVALRARVGERVLADPLADPVAVYVTSATPGLLDIEGRALLAGRWLTEEDVRSDADVAVAARSFIAASGEPPDRWLGRFVTIAGERHEIVGVVEEGRSAAPPELFVPFRLPYGHGTVEAAPAMLIRVHDGEEVPAAMREVQAWLDDTFWPGAAFVVSGMHSVETMLARVRAIKLVSGSIAGIAIVTGIIGIMNVMLASVLERTREIGIRSAVGARRRDVFMQFLLEALVVAGCGSILGLLLGFGAAAGITAIIRRTTAEAVTATLTPHSVASILALTVAIGILSGAYPARRAAGLSPVDAMRHE